MNVRFHREASGEAHCLALHGVSEREVQEVLGDPLDEFPGRSGSTIVQGQTGSGRFLQVVFLADDEPDSVFVVTAYPLSAKALRALRRRLKRS